MYSRKSAEPRMDHWGTSALTGYFYKVFPSRTTQKLPITYNKRNKAKYLTWNFIDLSLWRRPACQTLWKALDILNVTVWVTPDLLKALAILSDTIVRRLLTSFSKTNHRKKTNRAVVVSSGPFPNILKYKDHWWNCPSIWKTRLIQTHIKEFN